MTILQLVTKRQYRGAEVFAANLSTELISLGHKIVFAGLYKNEKDVLVVDDADNLDIAEAKTGKFSLSLVQKLVQEIRRIKPDVIQCNGSDTLKYAIAASFFTPKVPILYRNISIISEWITNKPKEVLYKNVFKRVDHVSSVGEEAVDDFIRTFGYPPSKISVIRRGIPIKEIKGQQFSLQLKKELGLELEDKIAVHVGNFSPEKNHDFLLDLFSDIKQENKNIKLICIGSGILYESIKKKVKERDLEDTIFLLGFRKDIPELLSASDCFVLSSKIEGVPGVILEAATQRKPSIATNVGGVSEVLIDGKTGYLIDDFDKDQFRKKLLELLLNDELRIEMGNNAFELVFEEFNPVKNAKKFESLYYQLKKNAN